MPLTQVSPGLLDTQANAQGFRNRLINGDCRVDQRNAGAAVTGQQYVVDRWRTWFDPGTYSFQQITDAPTGFTNSLRVTKTNTTQSNYAFLVQYIEGLNCADFAWGSASAQTVTISFWVKSSITGAFTVALSNSAENRFYGTTYTISAANTWEYKTVTIAGDTSGTWLTTNGIGIQVMFNFGQAATAQAANTWTASSNARAVTGSTSLGTTNNATWQITGVQLEKGTAATDFERLDYGRQLIQCQRYFESSMTVAPADNMTVASTGVYAMSTSGATPVITYAFKVNKRTEPTITYYAPLTTSPAGKVREDATGTIRNVTGGGTTNWGAIIGVTSGAATASYQFGYHASAEL